jgi:hypothetical protein
MMLYVEWCDPGCKQVGLKSFVVSIDYRDYMGSSSKIWALRCLFLYLCSYNLDGSVTDIKLESDLTYEERPVHVIDTLERVTQSQVVKWHKVIWSNQGSESDATWEREDYLWEGYK